MIRKHYSQDEVLALGKRVINPKRSYLLVNPLQAKHVPVSPTAALQMMRSLGVLVRQSCPGKCLVIGFAETATAVAAAVSSELDRECRYIQTTRDNVEGVRQWLLFFEEHSHATEQKLCGDGLQDWIASVDHIIIVDDEFSTGRTLINIARALKAYDPEAKTKDFVAASIINRVDDEHMGLLKEEGYRCIYLVKPMDEDYENKIAGFQVREAERIVYMGAERDSIAAIQLETPYLNPRIGVLFQEYAECCKLLSEEACQNILPILAGNKVLVLGTEECMYPALMVGKRLEKTSRTTVVRCHATTRSPIGISEQRGYPIRNGWRMSSFYDPERTSYLYNLQEYDTAIIVTDAKIDILKEGLYDLYAVLSRFGCENTICLEIGG